MKRIFLISYAAVSIWAILSVLVNGRRASRSFGWILTILVLPLIGPLIYYLFGVNRRKFKFYKLKKNSIRQLYDEKYSPSKITNPTVEFSSDTLTRLSTIITKSTSVSAYNGNDVEIYQSGVQSFDSIFSSIKTAKKFIHIQYYILANGTILDKLIELLADKVKEGIEVRVLYDSVGSFSFSGKLRKRLKSVGIKAFPTMPLRFGNFMYTLNYRNHRKIVVIDGVIGFVGGVNISDKYIGSDTELGIWSDIHLRIKGPAVDSLHRVFIKDYHFASGQKVLPSETYLPQIEVCGNSKVQIVTSGPDSKQPTIMYQYLSMIALARKRICIANPYFIPGSSVYNALVMASLGGTEVNLLLPKKSDSKIAKYSMYANFEGLMEAGVHIYLREDFSHSKAIIIDDELVSVGSGNFDVRSFEHNFETNALIYDENIAKEVVKEFNSHCTTDIRLDLKKFKKRSYFEKMKEGYSKLFSPLL